MHSLDPRELTSYPNNLWLYATHMGVPTVWVTGLSIAYFTHNKHFRAALKRLVKSDVDDCVKNKH